MEHGEVNQICNGTPGRPYETLRPDVAPSFAPFAWTRGRSAPPPLRFTRHPARSVARARALWDRPARSFPRAHAVPLALFCTRTREFEKQMYFCNLQN